MQRPSWLALLCVVCVGSFVALLFPSEPTDAASPEQQLVWLRAKSPQQLQQWVDNGLDVWQVEGDRALVHVIRDELPQLAVQDVDIAPAPDLGTPAFPACYRTYSDLALFSHEMQTRYSDLFRFYDVGDSWDTVRGVAERDIFVVQLSNQSIRTEKPKLFITAEHHAREIITVEVALMFIEDLLQNYDRDPQIHWLLDNREVWVMPMTNPDGHARVAELSDWRKNTDRPQLCPDGQPPNSYGVDLNRNYAYQWGLDVGSSPEPCNLTYRGTQPFSEPETQAVRDLVEQERFDLLLSLHSYGDEVLYPWGYTYHPAPDAENLQRIAYRMAQEAGYVAMQTWGVGYLGSGDTTDWAYGELGIPSFTFEIGGMDDGFFWPDCPKRQELYDEVRASLVYAAMIADDPYARANGPDVRQFASERSNQVVINVQADDMWNGGNAVAQIELFFDSPAEPGTGIQALPADGKFDTAREWGVFRLESAEVPAHARLMFLRARDEKGNWGPLKVAAVPWPASDSPTATPMPQPPHLTPVRPTTVPATPTATPVPPTTAPATPTLTPAPTPTPGDVAVWHGTRLVYLPLLVTD